MGERVLEDCTVRTKCYLGFILKSLPNIVCIKSNL